MLRSKGRIQQRSRKAIEREPERDRCRRIVLARDGYKCRVNIEGKCGTRMPGWLDVHEIKPRSAGQKTGSITDPDNCISVCRACHDHIHNNPNWAEDNGWKKSRYGGAA